MKRHWRGFLVGVAVVVVGYIMKGPAPFLTRPPKLPDGSAIRVQVLNGSGVTKAGLGLAEELRRKGFDVVEIGNAVGRQDSTVVIDRVERGHEDEALDDLAEGHADGVGRFLGRMRGLVEGGDLDGHASLFGVLAHTFVGGVDVVGHGLESRGVRFHLPIT